MTNSDRSANERLLLAILRLVQPILESSREQSEVNRVALEHLFQAITSLWVQVIHEGNCGEGRPSEGGH